MKRRIFWYVFYCFFRLPIYESIAAIFWQSASYVIIFYKFKLKNCAQKSTWSCKVVNCPYQIRLHAYGDRL